MNYYYILISVLIFSVVNSEFDFLKYKELKAKISLKKQYRSDLMISSEEGVLKGNKLREKQNENWRNYSNFLRSEKTSEDKFFNDGLEDDPYIKEVISFLLKVSDDSNKKINDFCEIQCDVEHKKESVTIPEICKAFSDATRKEDTQKNDLNQREILEPLTMLEVFNAVEYELKYEKEVDLKKEDSDSQRTLSSLIKEMQGEVGVFSKKNTWIAVAFPELFSLLRQYENRINENRYNKVYDDAVTQFNCHKGQLERTIEAEKKKLFTFNGINKFRYKDGKNRILTQAEEELSIMKLLEELVLLKEDNKSWTISLHNSKLFEYDNDNISYDESNYRYFQDEKILIGEVLENAFQGSGAEKLWTTWTQLTAFNDELKKNSLEEERKIKEVQRTIEKKLGMEEVYYDSDSDADDLGNESGKVSIPPQPLALDLTQLKKLIAHLVFNFINILDHSERVVKYPNANNLSKNLPISFADINFCSDFCNLSCDVNSDVKGWTIEEMYNLAVEKSGESTQKVSEKIEELKKNYNSINNNVVTYLDQKYRGSFSYWREFTFYKDKDEASLKKICHEDNYQSFIDLINKKASLEQRRADYRSQTLLQLLMKDSLQMRSNGVYNRSYEYGRSYNSYISKIIESIYIFDTLILSFNSSSDQSLSIFNIIKQMRKKFFKLLLLEYNQEDNLAEWEKIHENRELWQKAGEVDDKLTPLYNRIFKNTYENLKGDYLERIDDGPGEDDLSQNKFGVEVKWRVIQAKIKKIEKNGADSDQEEIMKMADRKIDLDDHWFAMSLNEKRFELINPDKRLFSGKWFKKNMLPTSEVKLKKEYIKQLTFNEEEKFPGAVVASIDIASRHMGILNMTYSDRLKAEVDYHESTSLSTQFVWENIFNLIKKWWRIKERITDIRLLLLVEKEINYVIHKLESNSNIIDRQYFLEDLTDLINRSEEYINLLEKGKFNKNADGEATCLIDFLKELLGDDLNINQLSVEIKNDDTEYGIRSKRLAKLRGILKEQFIFPGLLIDQHIYESILNSEQKLINLNRNLCYIQIMNLILIDDQRNYKKEDLLIYFSSCYSQFIFYKDEENYSFNRLNSLEQINSYYEKIVEENNEYLHARVFFYEEEVLQSRSELYKVVDKLHDEDEINLVRELFREEIINNEYMKQFFNPLLKKIYSLIGNNYVNFFKYGEQKRGRYAWEGYNNDKKYAAEVMPAQLIDDLFKFEIVEDNDDLNYHKKEYEMHLSFLLTSLLHDMLAAREKTREENKELIDFCDYIKEKYVELNEEIFRYLCKLNQFGKEKPEEEEKIKEKRFKQKKNNDNELLKKSMKKLLNYYIVLFEDSNRIIISIPLKNSMLDAQMNHDINELASNEQWLNIIKYFIKLNVFSESVDITKFKSKKSNIGYEEVRNIEVPNIHVAPVLFLESENNNPLDNYLPTLAPVHTHMTNHHLSETVDNLVQDFNLLTRTLGNLDVENQESNIPNEKVPNIEVPPNIHVAPVLFLEPEHQKDLLDNYLPKLVLDDVINNSLTNEHLEEREKPLQNVEEDLRRKLKNSEAENMEQKKTIEESIRKKSLKDIIGILKNFFNTNKKRIIISIGITSFLIFLRYLLRKNIILKMN